MHEVNESNKNLVFIKKNKILKTRNLNISPEATVIDYKNRKRHLSEFDVEEVSDEEFSKIVQSYLDKVAHHEEGSDENTKTDQLRQNIKHDYIDSESEDKDTLLEKITEKTDRYKLEKKLDRRREDNRLLDNLKHEIKKQKV